MRALLDGDRAAVRGGHIYRRARRRHVERHLCARAAKGQARRSRSCWPRRHWGDPVGADDDRRHVAFAKPARRHAVGDHRAAYAGALSSQAVSRLPSSGTRCRPITETFRLGLVQVVDRRERRADPPGGERTALQRSHAGIAPDQLAPAAPIRRTSAGPRPRWRSPRPPGRPEVRARPCREQRPPFHPVERPPQIDRGRPGRPSREHASRTFNNPSSPAAPLLPRPPDVPASLLPSLPASIATPIAAAMPISGAPRTRSERIASASSSNVRSSR